MVAGMLPLLKLVSQTTQNNPEQFGAAVGYIAGILIVALLLGHLSGKLSESVGGSYWLFAALGFLFGIFGLAAAIIYFFVMKSTRVRRSPVDTGAYYQPTYPPQPYPPYQHTGYPQQPPVPYQQPGYPQMPPPLQPWQPQPSQPAYQPPQPPPQAPPAAAGPASGYGMNKCTGCGADNPSLSSKCWRCEQELGSVSTGKTCHQCSSLQSGQADFCTECGALLDYT